MINAAFALDLGVMWRTGSPAYQSIVTRGLGLEENEKIVGFLYLGTKMGRRSRGRTPIILTLLANGVRMASRSVDMQCWKCGAELKNLLLPFSRYEECGKCRADLHACLGCRHYDPTPRTPAAKTGPISSSIKIKRIFATFSRAHESLQTPDTAAAQKARAALAEMFGEDLPADDVDSTQSDQALAELKRLFGESE